MKRTGFARKAPPPRPARQWTGTISPRAPAGATMVLVARPIVALPKENALQHVGYMAAVRLLACARCGFYRKGRIQFCHADEGKGTGLKTDCRRGWPGCAACHHYVGTSGSMKKADRRTFEARAGAQTRALIIAAGAWPARLPLWPGDDLSLPQENPQ